MSNLTSIIKISNGEDFFSTPFIMDCIRIRWKGLSRRGGWNLLTLLILIQDGCSWGMNFLVGLKFVGLKKNQGSLTLTRPIKKYLFLCRSFSWVFVLHYAENAYTSNFHNEIKTKSCKLSQNELGYRMKVCCENAELKQQ